MNNTTEVSSFLSHVVNAGVPLQVSPEGYSDEDLLPLYDIRLFGAQDETKVSGLIGSFALEMDSEFTAAVEELGSECYGNAESTADVLLDSLAAMCVCLDTMVKIGDTTSVRTLAAVVGVIAARIADNFGALRG